MTGRSGPAPAVLLAVAGGALAFWAAGRGWVATTTDRPAPLPPEVVIRDGRELVPWAAAVAAVAVAGGIALLATRGAGRILVAGLLAVGGAALVGAGVVGLAAGGGEGEVAPLWPVLTMIGGALVAAAGGLGLMRGRRWGGTAQRYEAPGDRAAPADDPAGVWDALDRGDDPTTR